jgi:hypothetical protein
LPEQLNDESLDLAAEFQKAVQLFNPLMEACRQDGISKPATDLPSMEWDNEVIVLDEAAVQARTGRTNPEELKRYELLRKRGCKVASKNDPLWKTI